MGGSMGGYQALEWALMEPAIIQDLFLIATSAAESPWGIAVHTAQRLSIEADSTWMDLQRRCGGKGTTRGQGHRHSHLPQLCHHEGKAVRSGNK